MAYIPREYVFARGATDEVNGTTVLTHPAGRWLQKDVDGSTVTWRERAKWYLDPENGDDANSGEASDDALRTLSELSRRFGNLHTLIGSSSTLINPINLVTVYILGDVPDTDRLNIHIVIPHNTLIAFVGTPTTLISGTFTAVTPQVRSTNTPWDVTDATITWANYIGKSIRVTSGVNTGQVGWVAKDLGAGKARISTPNDPGLATLPDSLQQVIVSPVTSGVFSPGDTFVIEDMSKIYAESLSATSPGSGTGVQASLGFANLEFNIIGDPGGDQHIMCNGGPMLQVAYTRCRFTGGAKLNPNANLTIFKNCGFFRGWQFFRSTANIYGGLTLNNDGVIRDGSVVLDYDHMIQGRTVSVDSGGLAVGTACAFDSTLDGFRVNSVSNGSRAFPHAALSVSAQISGSTALWGAGHTGRGVEIRSGTVMRYTAGTSASLTVTGASGDFRMSSIGNARAFNETTGTYTSAIAQTWANLAVTISSGGFEGNAHNLSRNIHLLSG